MDTGTQASFKMCSQVMRDGFKKNSKAPNKFRRI